jgi:hypothetical protein
MNVLRPDTPRKASGDLAGSLMATSCSISQALADNPSQRTSCAVSIVNAKADPVVVARVVFSSLAVAVALSLKWSAEKIERDMVRSHGQTPNLEAGVSRIMSPLIFKNRSPTNPVFAGQQAAE